jgi:hypothetical protein
MCPRPDAGVGQPLCWPPIVRPTRTVVGTALTVALALVALPGLAASSPPSAAVPIEVGALQPLPVPASASRPALAVAGPDAGYLSHGVLREGASLVEPDALPPADPPRRPDPEQPEPAAASARKPPRATLTGLATFYDHGTTAMRLPRGTVVVICGAGGCIERVVSDYGPQKPERIVDLYRPDFFEICGCGWWDGVTEVTVYVY